MINILFNIHSNLNLWTTHIEQLKSDYLTSNIDITDDINKEDLSIYEIIVTTRYSKQNLNKSKNLIYFKVWFR